LSRSKTTVPPPLAEFVSRPALVSALDRGADQALTLVCAPAGYGKTVLLADWARQQPAACAWVDLDAEDDDPRKLWVSVLAAVSECADVPPSSPLRRLVVPRTTVEADFFADLLEALATLPARICLVLDDAHHLRSAEVMHGLRLLLRHRPSTLRLVLSSRFDPPLPVARLRLEERLCEVRTEHLGFSADETAALAGLCGLDLSDRQIAVLHERTEGWVAGIRLAAMQLRGHRDPDTFLAAFSGDERPVADYLAGEVLAHISADEADVLRRISITDPVPAALATELSGRSDAPELLSGLERTTGLVLTTGPRRDEFRIQELMRTHLSADLTRHGTAQTAQLHAQAAVWWAAQQEPVPALSHAAHAADATLLTGLLHRWAPTLVARGEHSELRRALSAAGAGGDADDPWPPLVSAQLHIGNGDLRGARAEVARADAMTGRPGDDDDLADFHAATRQLSGMGGPAPEGAGTAAEPAVAALALAGRAVSWIFSDAAGTPTDPTAVLGGLEDALATARDQRFGLLEVQCLCLLGAAASRASDHRRAAAAAGAAMAVAAAHGWQGTWWAATASAILAHSSLQRALPARALEVSVQALRMAPATEDQVLRFALRTARGGALFDLGDRARGLLELQEAQTELGGTPLPTTLAASAALLEHRAALLLGSPAAAATSKGRLAARGSAAGELALMDAWSLAAEGFAAEARSTVLPLLEGRLPPVMASTVVEAWLLEVWGALRTGDRPAARQALQAALTLAEPLDTLRPFALAGQGLRVLLVDQLNGDQDPAAFAFRCLTARQRVNRSAAPELSAREHDVLTQLISLSNLGEIADDLAVSVNTIKTHVRAIYGKLGVNTRRTAVLSALERGLLT
jgi:LuxR family transcriptional regulator, maltose regulon positive regulatory protein